MIDVFADKEKNLLVNRLNDWDFEGIKKRINQNLAKNPKDIDYYCILADYYSMLGKEEEQKAIVDYVEKTVEDSYFWDKQLWRYFVWHWYLMSANFEKALFRLEKTPYKKIPWFGVDVLVAYNAMWLTDKYKELLYELYDEGDVNIASILLDYIHYHIHQYYDRERCEEAIEVYRTKRWDGSIIYLWDEVMENVLFDALNREFNRKRWIGKELTKRLMEKKKKD